MEILKKYVGKQIERALSKRGIKQKALADKLEIDQPNVSRWVTGKNLPTDEHFTKMCDFLETKPDELLFPKEDLSASFVFDIIRALPTLDEDQLRGVLNMVTGQVLNEEAPAMNTTKQAKRS